MKRTANTPYSGDFSSLEETHILFGRMGTPQDPVIVDSVYPTRTVGCVGSIETKQHDLIWHVVKREKPCMCLECGQVFQLRTADCSTGDQQEIYPFHHAGDAHY